MSIDPGTAPAEEQPPADVGMPVFRGAAELVALIRQLYDRPRRGELPAAETSERQRRRHGLPMVCIVRPDGVPVLPALATYLVSARPTRIPHALVSCGPAQPVGADCVEQLAELLRQLAQRLNRGINAGYGRLRFPLFELLYWLLQQDVGGQAQEPDHVLFERLRERSLTRHRFTDVTGSLSTDSTAVPSMPGWAASVLRALPPLWFRVKVSGRLPVVGAEYRWLRRQQQLTPHDSETPVGVAERLTRGMRAEENTEQLRKLLVDTFLEDLRRAYRRRPWRPRAARRTTYLVALLDGITGDNGGEGLLRLVNDVRNETDAFDPLLLVCGSREVPGPAADAPVQVWSAPQARNGYRYWCQQLVADSPARTPIAWYLPVEIPATPLAAPDGPVTEANRAYVDEQQALLLVRRFAAAAAPFWSRRWASTVVSMGLAVCLALAFLPRLSATATPDGCPGASVRTVLESVPGSPGLGCIGFTDGRLEAGSGGNPFRTAPSELVTLTTAIFEQNRQVDRLVAERHRLAFTIVYLGQITGIPTDKAYGYASDVEELTGLRLAQARGINDARTDPSPLIRIVVANAGYQMRYAKRAAELVVALKRREPAVLAVLGLVESRATTSDALAVFQSNGLMSVVPTLSADTLPQRSHFHLQIAPPNRTQARLVAAFLRREAALRTGGRRPIRTIRVLYTTGGTSLAEDTYVDTLTSGLVAELAALPGDAFDGERHDWAQQPTALPCGPGAVAVFAGRYSEFRSFLDAVSRCPVPPAVIGNDSTSRFMASPDFRQTAPNLPLLFVAKGYLASCAALAENSSGARGQFLRLARDELKACGPDGKPIGEKVGLAYDAANLVTDTVDTLLRRMADERGTPGRDLSSITSLAVHADILDRYAEPASSYPGISGALSFTADGVPVDKAIHLVGVRQINNPDEVPVARYGCGRGAQHSAGCPAVTS